MEAVGTCMKAMKEGPTGSVEISIGTVEGPIKAVKGSMGAVEWKVR